MPIETNDPINTNANSDGPFTEGQPKPWEQRAGPGLGGGGGRSGPAPSAADSTEVLSKLGQATLEVPPWERSTVIERQTDLVYLPMVDTHTTPDTDLAVKCTSNEEVWKHFNEERLYDTRRVTLEHMHLFEWFPNSPGEYHTPAAAYTRQEAYQDIQVLPNGQRFFSPAGKGAMVNQGGIGAVRLRPRQINGEAHYFMTASSTGVCHEGFPVLIPRRFYAPLKQRMIDEGAAPVTLQGEMRYVPQEAVSFFGGRRDLPLLYLHVDQVQALPRPRSNITGYSVSGAVSFVSEVDHMQGMFCTYATFDPASQASITKAADWIEQFYVGQQYPGVVVTDFDEQKPRFPNAIFGLPDLLRGKLDAPKVRAWLHEHGLGDPDPHFLLVYKEINTHGGAYIAGDVNTGGGDFIVGDQTASTSTPSSPAGHKLYAILKDKWFSEADLQDLCFQLDIDWDALNGKNKIDKARSLGLDCEKNGKVAKLLGLVKLARPNLDDQLRAI